MSVYMIAANSLAEEYVSLSGNFEDYQLPCMKSELQYLDQKPARFTIDTKGGLEFPDILLQEGIHFISDQFRWALDEFGVKEIFCKRADVTSDIFGLHETYWMLVPPRIDCLDLDRSRIRLEWDLKEGLLPQLSLREDDRVVISEPMIGHYQMFKIQGLLDNHIYITEELYQRLQPLKLTGIAYIKLQ